jgi:hypothetical protein
MIFSLSFREIKNFVFAKTFAKVLYFRKESFAKTKSLLCENFREKTKAKTFVPTLVKRDNRCVAEPEPQGAASIGRSSNEMRLRLRQWLGF